MIGEFNRVRENYAAGNLEDCITGLQRIIALDPAEPYGFLADVLLGDVYARQGRHEEAVGSYRKAVARNIGRSEPLANMGNSLMKLRRYKEAAEAYRAALRINPNDHVAQHNVSAAEMLAKAEAGGGITYL